MNRFQTLRIVLLMLLLAAASVAAYLFSGMNSISVYYFIVDCSRHHLVCMSMATENNSYGSPHDRGYPIFRFFFELFSPA